MLVREMDCVIRWILIALAPCNACSPLEHISENLIKNQAEAVFICRD